MNKIKSDLWQPGIKKKSISSTCTLYKSCPSRRLRHFKVELAIFAADRGSEAVFGNRSFSELLTSQLAKIKLNTCLCPLQQQRATVHISCKTCQILQRALLFSGFSCYSVNIPPQLGTPSSAIEMRGFIGSAEWNISLPYLWYRLTMPTLYLRCSKLNHFLQVSNVKITTPIQATTEFVCVFVARVRCRRCLSGRRNVCRNV